MSECREYKSDGPESTMLHCSGKFRELLTKKKGNSENQTQKKGIQMTKFLIRGGTMAASLQEGSACSDCEAKHDHELKVGFIIHIISSFSVRESSIGFLLFSSSTQNFKS